MWIRILCAGGALEGSQVGQGCLAGLVDIKVAAVVGAMQEPRNPAQHQGLVVLVVVVCQLCEVRERLLVGPVHVLKDIIAVAHKPVVQGVE